MKLKDIEEAFKTHGWVETDVTDSSSYGTDIEYSKNGIKMFVEDYEGIGPCFSLYRNSNDAKFIGEILDFEFGKNSLNVLFYSGTAWLLDFEDNSPFPIQVIDNHHSPVEKPDDWADVDYRPHYFEFEVIETNKCIARAFAHSEKEALEVIHSISQETWDTYIDERLDFYNLEFKKIKEKKYDCVKDPQFCEFGEDDYT